MNANDNKKPHVLEPRDALVYTYLQLQRALVLICISFFEKKNGDFKFSNHILEIQDSKQIIDYQNYLERLRRRPVVRFASWLHSIFDKSKKLKAPLITLFLYFRFFKKVLFPQKMYNQYGDWVAKMDSPTDSEVSNWADELRSKPYISILILPNALADSKLVSQSIHNLVNFNTNWFFYGATSELSHLKRSLVKFGIDIEDPKFNFIIQTTFNKDLHELSNFENADPNAKLDEWIIIQNEVGILSKRCPKEINDWLLESGKKSYLAFSDSDSIDKKHERFGPKFHPNWNLRYFVGQNCFRGIAIVSRTKLYESLSDESLTTWPKLLVRLIELSEIKSGGQIGHIPKVLFHCNKTDLPENIYTEASSKHQREIRTELSQSLKMKYDAGIEVNTKNIASIAWPLPKELPTVSILIPTRDQSHLLKKLVNGLRTETDYPNIEIVIVDNGSVEVATKVFFKELLKDPLTRVIPYPFPFNFSAINNFGFKHCSGEILVLLNNDIEVMRSDWLKEGVREILAPDVGAVGAKLYYKNGFIQHAGVVLGSRLAGHIHSFERRSSSGYCDRLQFPHELSAVTAACMFVRSEVFERLGGFNEKDLSIAYNDIDLCLRIRELGLKIVWTPKVELYHLESASRPPDTRLEQITRYQSEIQYMLRRWSHIVRNDPFYNPNFAADKFNFELPG